MVRSESAADPHDFAGQIGMILGVPDEVAYVLTVDRQRERPMRQVGFVRLA